MSYFVSMSKLALKWVFRRPSTTNYPFEPRVPLNGSRGWLLFNKDHCVFCNVCAKKCPTAALQVNRAEKTFAIERLRCITCGSCVELCPKKSLELSSGHGTPQTTKDPEFLLKGKNHAKSSDSSRSGLAKYAWREIDREEPPHRPAAARVADFGATTLPYDETTAREQARRCIQCPDPSCVKACPLDRPITELLALTADGQFKEAAELLFSTHHVPEIAAHVCDGGRICERACILADKSYSVPIRALSRFLLDYGWKHGLAEPAVVPAKGQTVAVIGSGIGGMVAADALTRKGYKVTVFDSRQKPGGRMMNGLPGFRMDKDLVERRIGLLKQRGIGFRMGVSFGQDVKLSDLRREFDAVFLGFGTADPVPLDVPGAELQGVHQAFPFVLQNVLLASGSADNRPGPQPADSKTEHPVNVQGKRVVVLGGGDTAIDVLRIAIRRGATDAICLYRRNEASMPADAEEFANAQKEGARFMDLTQPVAVLGNASGEVTHVRCIPMQPVEPDSTGRAGVEPAAGAPAFDVPADRVFVAYGFTAPRPPDSDDFARLATDERGYLQLDANQMTNFSGVFAGGSIASGPVHLVQVVLDARKATDAIDQYLIALRSQTT